MTTVAAPFAKRPSSRRTSPETATWTCAKGISCNSGKGYAALLRRTDSSPHTRAGSVPWVARSLDLTAESPHPIERIRAAFDDEGYWQYRLHAFGIGAPTLDELAVTATGTAVAMTMRFTADQLPGPVQKLRLGGIHVVQREQWTPVASGRARGDITVDALKTPIAGHGFVDLAAAGDGTHLSGTARVNVSVPLVGGAIAGFLAGQLANGILDIVRVTDSWLSST